MRIENPNCSLDQPATFEYLRAMVLSCDTVRRLETAGAFAARICARDRLHSSFTIELSLLVLSARLSLEQTAA